MRLAFGALCCTATRVTESRAGNYAHMAVTERSRIAEMAKARDWCRWGPYLSERQWGTVREDYSTDGDAWAYFRMIMPAPAPIAETRTASAAFATINSRFA